MEERRRFVRLDDKLPVMCRPVESAQAVPTVTRNVGGGGISFFSSEPWKVGTYVSIEIKVPERPKPIVFTGEVIWCEDHVVTDKARNIRASQVGVRFLTIDPDDQQAIVRHCSSTLQSNLSS